MRSLSNKKGYSVISRMLFQLIILAVSIFSTFGHTDWIVSCPSGSFKGSELTAPNGLRFTSFRGIPYALPPIGNRRFGKPLPHPKIKDAYDATKAGPICLQPVGVDIGDPGQEDCLYLNVFTPQGISQDKNNDLKKVMIYIHGGAFFMGSGNEYVPGDLVTEGDIIVVTSNYRLSWLGFLKGKSPQLPGNQGLWDQLMAIEWVKDNILDFGGDPSDITLAGQSMGGESVSVWSIVEQSKHLFTKGIVMSGTMFSCPSTPGSSDVLLEFLVDRVGCEPLSQPTGQDTWSEETMSEVIKCLQTLPPEAFRLPAEGSLTNKFTSIDEELFPLSIQELVADRDYLSKVGFFSKTFLTSLTNHEGAPLTNGIFAAEGAEESIKEFLSKKTRVPLSVINRAYEWYSQPHVASINVASDIWSDPILVVPTFKFVDTHSKKEKGTKPEEASGKSFFLWFDHMPSYLPSPHKGTFHSLDLTYIFDFTPSYVLKSFYYIDSNMTFTNEDFTLKSSMIKIVADFVKYGNPGKSLVEEHNIEWPQYDPESQYYLNFKENISVQQFPLKARRDLWSKQLPKWTEEFVESAQRKVEL